MKKNKLNIPVKLGFFLVFMLLLMVSSVFAVPLTLSGQKAGCSITPAYTQNYENGGKVYMFQSDAMFNFYRVDPVEGWVFLDEYNKKIDLVKPAGTHYVVEMYDGCDFGELWNPLSNGKPDLVESCEDTPGYVSNGNNCVPTEQKRLSTLKESCQNQGKNWYDDTCNAEMDVGKQAKQVANDFFRSTLFIMIVWFGAIVVMLLVLIKTGIWKRLRALF